MVDVFFFQHFLTFHFRYNFSQTEIELDLKLVHDDDSSRRQWFCSVDRRSELKI